MLFTKERPRVGLEYWLGFCLGSQQFVREYFADGRFYALAPFYGLCRFVPNVLIRYPGEVRAMDVAADRLPLEDGRFAAAYKASPARVALMNAEFDKRFRLICNLSGPY